MKKLIIGAVFATLSSLASTAYSAEKEVAMLAGGCFWCIEKDFEHVTGVLDVQSGYAGGISDDPTYKNHTKAKHLEVVKIEFDPSVINYEKLLNIFWRTVDPTDPGGQFCDRGHSYTTAVFALNDEQQKIAEASKSEIEASGVLGKPVATPIREAATFYPAEKYHQNYYKKNPLRYNFYRKSCGRDKTVKALWGDQAYRGVNKIKAGS